MHGDALQRLRHRAREAGLEGLLLFAPVNLQYLTGFHSNAYSRPLALLLPLEGDPALIVPRLEDLQARRLTRARRRPELRRVGRRLGRGRRGRGRVAGAPPRPSPAAAFRAAASGSSGRR